ncbi:N-acetylmuramoyl-L-alanine amidase [Bacillus sp. BGMRC 2118]|nr:N-acetylmuramoyl-L-alanine amidase [Bacillus sp. BGMRC 2118]
MVYSITRDYIRFGNSRSGETLDDVKFIVSHDTGNPGSSAYANRNYFDRVQPSASAHTFIDDNYILEIIPTNEKAWHVRYGVNTDNNRYGEDANDAAIGVELAYGGKIDFWEAYKRYVWYHAYLARKYNLNPQTDIIAHSMLDPARRTDPQNALRKHGISWNEFINDVTEVYQNFDESNPTPPMVKGTYIDLPLSIDDKGTFVKEIQQDLIRAGFNLPIYGADGIYGQETRRAVLNFQKKYNLLVDGLVGNQTLGKLNEVLSSSKPIAEFPLPTGILKQGDSGEEVKQLQRALKEINFDPVYIDGIYGPRTEDAVRRFQSMYAELANDGIYGPNTKEFIEMALANKS